MQQDRFVIEGEVTMGPHRYPIFVDSRVLGPTVIEYFQPQKIGDYHRLGRARITIELLEEE